MVNIVLAGEGKEEDRGEVIYEIDGSETEKDKRRRNIA